MLRKLLFPLVLLLYVAAGKAQSSTNPCTVPYSISSRDIPESEIRIKSAGISWDFSEYSGLSATIRIEVIPIKDCWELGSGTQFREQRDIKIEASNLTGSVVYSVVELRAKCFKYRVVIDNGCHEESDWKFQSIIPNRY